MKRTQYTLILSLLLVFASGTVVGAFGLHLYEAKTVTATSRKSPDDFRRAYVEDLRTRLGLNVEQVVKLNTVLDQTRAQYKDVRDRMKPDMNRIKSEQIEKVNSMLSPEQQQKYEVFRTEQSNKAKQGAPPGF